MPRVVLLACSEVWKASDKATGELVALKKLRCLKDSDDVRALCAGFSCSANGSTHRTLANLVNPAVFKDYRARTEATADAVSRKLGVTA